MKVNAAVVRRAGEPFELAELDLEEPRPDEVLVRLVASGICHADLAHEGRPLPMVFGHEGAGVVERVGSAVRTLAPGDHVVLGPDACGQCSFCLGGHRSYCRLSAQLNFGGQRLDGSTALSEDGRPVHGHFFGQSSFASHCLASERNAVKVNPDLPLDLLGPLGCGVETGAGTVFNIFRPTVGSSIAMFGVGSVGMSALLAAVASGCATIIAVDINPKRLTVAESLGASHCIDARKSDPTAEILAITAGHGVEFAFTTAGGGAVIRQAVDALDGLGRCAFVAGGGEINLPASSITRGKTLGGVAQGDSIPRLTIPRLIDLWRRGRFPFDRLVAFFPFEEINAAGQASLDGDVVKPVLRMPA